MYTVRFEFYSLGIKNNAKFETREQAGKCAGLIQTIIRGLNWTRPIGVTKPYKAGEQFCDMFREGFVCIDKPKKVTSVMSEMNDLVEDFFSTLDLIVSTKKEPEWKTAFESCAKENKRFVWKIGDEILVNSTLDFAVNYAKLRGITTIIKTQYEVGTAWKDDIVSIDVLMNIIKF